MTNVADAAPVSGQAQPPSRTSLRGMLAQTEIDLRLFGMLVALAAILLTFNILSGGKLIQPTNMVTMAVQAAGIAIIATGMVLVIVSRNIDLSVGSLVGLIAMSYALLMTDWFPRIFGIGADVPFQWVLALALGIGLGAAIGALQGFIIAYIGVPVVHRHARRPALDPWPRLVPVAGCSGDRPRPDVPAHRRRRPGLGRRDDHVDPRRPRLRGDHRAAVQRSPPTPPLRLPAPADVGGDPPRRRRLRRVARAGLVRQQLLLARGPGEPDRPRAELGSRRPRAAGRSRPASRSPSSCSSA